MDLRIRILVTGIEGFTGRHLRDLLEQRSVEYLGTTGSVTSNDAHLRRVDLLDKEKVRKVFQDFAPTHVVHLAAISNVSHTSIDEMLQVNVLGTCNLLEAAKECETVDKVLLASSANLYGNSKHSEPSEQTSISPSNEYGISKAAMEMFAELYKSHFKIIVTRPFNYTGTGQTTSFLVPKIVEHFRSRAEVLALGNIEVEREFNDVRDVVDIYFQLLVSRQDDTLFVVNIGSGIGHSLMSIVNKLSAISNHTLVVKTDPRFVRPNEIPRLVGNTTRLFEHLNGNPFKRSIDDTLEWMLNSV